MANNLGPVALSDMLRKRIYHFVLEGEVLIFSKPSSNENKPITTFLDASYSQYFIKRERKSALAIAGVSTAVRATALPILACVVRFDLGNKAAVQWFRDTFPSSFRKTIEYIIIRHDATTHFGVPSVRFGWAALKTVTILELPCTETYRLKEKTFNSTDEATAWTQDNWAVVFTGKTYSPASASAISTILDVPGRSFGLFCAVYVNESTDAVAKLTKVNGKVEVEAVELVTPGLPGERREDKRQEYFEMKRTGYRSVPEEAMAKLWLWTKPAGQILG